MNKRRHFITALLAAMILFLPYWLYLPALFLATVFLPLYWEAVLLGFFIDVLYGGQAGAWPLLRFRTALAALLLVAALMPLRERFRWSL